ncbi:hypothetical protein BDN72DRAFT_907575 [Pluteus cervinus]|uniref:Uncharacterized protein n=1 Tax=Pluteus cervinus TaxID=181527 RepID=A0ACD2ZWI8_9AGAR|nr:hypothetical protein BDN72DRAFT_907575 [Pluteus cervinus]
MNQAPLYRGIPEQKKRDIRRSTLQNLEIARYNARDRTGRPPSDGEIWKSLRDKTISRNIRGSSGNGCTRRTNGGRTGSNHGLREKRRLSSMSQELSSATTRPDLNSDKDDQEESQEESGFIDCVYIQEQ